MSNEDKYNGSSLQCGGVYEWEAHREEFSILRKDVSDMKTLLLSLQSSNQHLAAIEGTLVELKDVFVKALLNKDSTPLSVTQTLLEGQRNGYVGIIKVLCTTFGIVLIALVGLKYAAPHLFQ